MRYIFITGVSRGLGHSLSKAFESENTRIVGFGRSKGDFDGVFHTCDFTKPTLAARIFESALQSEDLENAESIVFISNAGKLGQIGKAEDIDVVDIEQTISANLSGSAIAATGFLRRTFKLDTTKAFIQISSGAALPDRVKGRWSLYCASKAGQEQLIRAIAKEQAKSEFPCKMINVNPGVMETAMQVEIRNTPPETFPEVDEFIRLKDEGRVPSPDDIAQRITALIDDFESLESGRTYTLADYR